MLCSYYSCWARAFNATMTLPGIAGIILSMGVAVDANILIFERFKGRGVSGNLCVLLWKQALACALATITDANVSLSITAGILTILGSGPVRLRYQLRRRCVVVEYVHCVTVTHFLCAY